MNFKTENEKLTICLEGRIDSVNAPEVEKELLSIAESNADKLPEIDAKGLEFISSAGLRVLMKLLKMKKHPLNINNVSSEVYEIFDVTGFTELFNVNKKLREISVEGCDMIGFGGYGKVYRIDRETIAKIYKPGIALDFVDRERECSREAFILGIPTAIPYDTVLCGESYGVVYELLEAKTVAELITEDPSKLQALCHQAATVLKSIHSIEVPEKTRFHSRKDILKNAVKELYADALTQDEKEKIYNMIDSVPDRRNFLHGDFNSKNIMMQNGEVHLIDIGDAAFGHPVFDIIMLMLAYIIPQDNQSTPAEERRELLGFDLEYAPQVWGTMCGTYFGVSDPAEIERITKQLMPFYLLFIAYQGALSGRVSLEILTEHVIRPQLLPILKQGYVFDGSIFND